MLPTDNIEIVPGGIRIVVGPPCVRASLVVWIQAGWKERSARRTSIVRVEFGGHAQRIQCIEKVPFTLSISNETNKSGGSTYEIGCRKI